MNQHVTDGPFMAVLLGMFMTFFLVFALIALFMLVCHWRIFTKAGKPGWAAIIPIYNIIVMLEIVGKPLWWLILLCIPFVNLVILIILVIELAKSFGKGTGFAIGLMFLSIIFIPILAFGSATYVGPGGIKPAEPAPSV